MRQRFAQRFGVALLAVSPNVLAQSQGPAPDPGASAAATPRTDAKEAATAASSSGTTANSGKSAESAASATPPDASSGGAGSPNGRPSPMLPPPDEANTEQAPSTADPASPTPVDFWHEYLPRSGELEIGYFVGFISPSSTHNFQDQELVHRRISTGAIYGHRISYFPHQTVGLEIEGAVAPTTTSNGHDATLWTVRGEIVGQLPIWRLVPFVVIGGGRMGVLSSTLGNDGDPLFHYGAGAKIALGPSISARLDLRDNLTQKHLASDGTVTHHLEMSLGITLRLSTMGEPNAAPAAVETSSGRQWSGTVPPDARRPAHAPTTSAPADHAAPESDGVTPSTSATAPEPTPPPALDP